LPDGRNSRVVALEKLREADIGFSGGLVHSKEYHSPLHLTVRGISRRHHNRLLQNSKICLAIWGNNPLTYRLFEGFSLRCLVIAQSLRAIEFIDCGLKPDVHYVEVKPDLSDLTDKIDYYLRHERRAQEIADNGYFHFKKHYQFSGVNLPQSIFERITATWQGLIEPTMPKSVLYPVRSGILNYLKSI
ncbi:MAG: glycosyltransferase family 1 protein, partial [Chlorobiales bacterium]|nr:glycosyltransferase family 1 protein [Chlorobiales bacterium]